MKQLFAAFFICAFILSCNDSSTEDNTATDTSSVSTPAPSTDTTSSASATTMKDGVMAMKDGKMMVMNAGNWQPMTEAVTCTNGRKVSPNGEVSKGDRKRNLTEGMMIDKDGQIMDKDGKMVDNTGWE